MSYGLIDRDGKIFVPEKIECQAEVTDDFGLFTLVHTYTCDIVKSEKVRFVFPVTDTMEVVSFKASINEHILNSSIIPKPPMAESASYFSFNRSNGLEVPIGELIANDKVIVEIVYVRQLNSDNERTRIVIPTGVAPRFMYFGTQIGLESLFEEVNYNITLNVLCKNYSIKNVVSPTHEIYAVYGENCVEIKLADSIYADRDIIIDVFSVAMDKPKFIKYENYLNCSFVPELNVYEETPRDYLFLIDVSNDMNMRKIQQVRNAIQICIRTLKNGDRFNLAFTQSENTFFSYEYLPLNDDTLRAATRWLNSYEQLGVPEFYRPMLEAYSMSENATVIFISDGRIGGNASIIEYARDHKGLRFYNFGFDLGVNQEFLTELSTVTGGKTRFIGHTERIDDTVIKAFNVIVSPSIDNAVVRFDSSVSEVTPGMFNKIHCGERINIMFKYMDILPQKMYIIGLVGGRETVCTVNIDRVIQGGRELEYRFGYECIQNLMRDLYYTDENNRYMIRQKIIEKSIEYSIHSKYTMFNVSDKSGWFSCECDTDKYNEISSRWYEPSLDTNEKTMNHSVREIQFIEIAKKQRANGRFIPSDSRSKEAIALNTAKIVLDFCNNCSNVMMYRWHLRKSVLFLLEHIENADYAIVPNVIINALNEWNRIFGSVDEASQKIDVLSYLHDAY